LCGSFEGAKMAVASVPVALLSRALDQVGVLIAGIRDDQKALPTPCRSWDVAALIAHLVNDTAQFVARAAGETPDWTASATDVGADPHAAFQRGAAALLDAWRRAGDLTGIIQLPGMGEMPARFPVDQQITEFALHAWDLARATGGPPASTQRSDGPRWIGRAAQCGQSRGDEADGKAFGPEVEVPANAPICDRLAVFFGRQPG